jgi:rhodanese-related sulfurtransferase
VTFKTIDAPTLKSWLHDGSEIALLDAREEVPFDLHHILMAACVPLGRLEVIVGDSVPRRAARVVWCDDGEGLAARAATRMAGLGYTDVSVLTGGIAAWENAGYRIYSGVHVPSKAFAEVVEHEAHTPWVDAAELNRSIQSGTDMVLFDSRSYEEFHNNSIPSAISVPGAELLYRFADMVPSPDTLVVVNCGGRTRSIIGAQSLINAGVPNKVVSMQNGTQGWHLAGLPVLKGETRRAPAVSASGHAKAKAAAARVAERFGVRSIDAATLAAWKAEANTRALFVFDVRSPEEYAAGHLPGMKNVPGGQLVQETDRHAAIWGGRVVCVDDDGVRAIMTAHWMIQMGWEAVALTLDRLNGETGPYVPPAFGLTDAPAISVSDLAGRSAVVVDLDWSRIYYDGHIPGAWYAIRARLAEDFSKLPRAEAIVFTSGDGILARLAAAEWNGKAPAPVFALTGGTQAWAAAGHKLETGASQMASAAADMRLRAREMPGKVEDAMNAYLTWEIELANQMATDEDQRFRVMAERK